MRKGFSFQSGRSPVTNFSWIHIFLYKVCLGFLSTSCQIPPFFSQFRLDLIIIIIIIIIGIVIGIVMCKKLTEYRFYEYAS